MAVRPSSPDAPSGDRRRRKVDEGAGGKAVPVDDVVPAPAPRAGGIEPPRDELAPSARKVVFVLDGATLETAKIGKGYELLSGDEHAGFLRKHGKDPAAYRPDIIHAALLAVLDSPLNKSGHVSDVYVRTAKNVLFRVDPSTRLPRTPRRFAGLMVQLLHKLSIRSTNGPDRLLRVVKGPVQKLLPAGAHRVAFSVSADKVVKPREHFADYDDNTPLVFVVGAFSHGHVDDGWVDEYLSISRYPLSAVVAIGRVTGGLEDKWGIM